MSSVELSLEDLKRVCHLPERQAAEALGISLSHLQTNIYALKIPHWPHRQIASLTNLVKLIEEVHALGGLRDDEVQEHMDVVKHNQERFKVDLKHQIPKELLHLREALWKRRHHLMRKGHQRERPFQPRKRRSLSGSLPKKYSDAPDQPSRFKEEADEGTARIRRRATPTHTTHSTPSSPAMHSSCSDPTPGPILMSGLAMTNKEAPEVSFLDNILTDMWEPTAGVGSDTQLPVYGLSHSQSYNVLAPQADCNSPFSNHSCPTEPSSDQDLSGSHTQIKVDVDTVNPENLTWPSTTQAMHTLHIAQPPTIAFPRLSRRGTPPLVNDHALDIETPFSRHLPAVESDFLASHLHAATPNPKLKETQSAPVHSAYDLQAAHLATAARRKPVVGLHTQQSPFPPSKLNGRLLNMNVLIEPPSPYKVPSLEEHLMDDAFFEEFLRQDASVPDACLRALMPTSTHSEMPALPAPRGYMRKTHSDDGTCMNAVRGISYASLRPTDSMSARHAARMAAIKALDAYNQDPFNNYDGSYSHLAAHTPPPMSYSELECELGSSYTRFKPQTLHSTDQFSAPQAYRARATLLTLNKRLAIDAEQDFLDTEYTPYAGHTQLRCGSEQPAPYRPNMGLAQNYE